MIVATDELERIVKRYVSTGAAVVIVILGPGPATGPDGQPSTAPTTVTVQPLPPTGDGDRSPTTATPPTVTLTPPASVPPDSTRPPDRPRATRSAAGHGSGCRA